MILSLSGIKVLYLNNQNSNHLYLHIHRYSIASIVLNPLRATMATVWTRRLPTQHMQSTLLYLLNYVVFLKIAARMCWVSIQLASVAWNFLYMVCGYVAISHFVITSASFVFMPCGQEFCFRYWHSIYILQTIKNYNRLCPVYRSLCYLH